MTALIVIVVLFLILAASGIAALVYICSVLDQYEEMLTDEDWGNIPYIDDDDIMEF